MVSLNEVYTRNTLDKILKELAFERLAEIQPSLSPEKYDSLSGIIQFPVHNFNLRKIEDAQLKSLIKPLCHDSGVEHLRELLAPHLESVPADNWRSASDPDELLDSLKGKALISTVIESGEYGDRVEFEFDGFTVALCHHQDCCESVYLQDVCGDVDDLQDALLIDFRVDTVDVSGQGCESGTASFYNVQTNKGHVQLVWRGESNGYYSETVNIEALITKW